jgi:hypothetical protein
LELSEWLALFVSGGLIAGGAGYNLMEFALYGRFYVMARGAEHYWAYWHADAAAIVEHGSWTLFLFAVGASLLATALIYPVLILRWGKTSPRYKTLPPLSIKD